MVVGGIQRWRKVRRDELLGPSRVERQGSVFVAEEGARNVPAVEQAAGVLFFARPFERFLLQSDGAAEVDVDKIGAEDIGVGEQVEGFLNRLSVVPVMIPCC